MLKEIFISLPLAFLLQIACGQSPFFKEYSLGEAYPNVAFELVFEDGNSALWFGTREGLFLFDGLGFHQYLKKDSTSNYVRSIYRDRKGKLWIGYEDGTIFHLKGQQLQLWQPEEGLPKAAITGFLEDSKGKLWIATYGEGVYYMDSGRLYNINTDDGLLGDDIYAIAKDRQGRIWAGTDGGVSICDATAGNKKLQNLTKQDGLPDDIVRTLIADASGNMWIGTYDHGIAYYDLGRKQFNRPIPIWENGIVISLALFEDRELWVGTEGNGLWRYSLQEGSLKQVPGWPRAKIFDLHKDIEGNVWVVSNVRGICSANRQFELVETRFDNIQAILSDTKNQIWIGTSSGLYQMSNSSSGDLEYRQFLKNVPLNVLSLFQDSFGNIWAGTFGQGLYCIQPTTDKFRHFTEQDGLSNNNILSIDGSDDRIWLATLGGATEIAYAGDVMDGIRPTFKTFSDEQGLGTNFIYKVFVDSKGRTWFGTDGKGISLLENGAIKNFSNALNTQQGKDGKENGALLVVYSITEDQEGNIWLSTAKDGIFKFDGKNFYHLTMKEGIRNLQITSLITDANGKILIVHPSGIDILTPETGHLIYYDREVGIHNIDPNLNAACTGSGGHIWLGAKNTIIRYTALKENLEIHPRTVLNSVSVFLKSIDFQNIRTFSHGQNNLVFDFMGLWYTDPAVVKYRYQLKGYDLGWIETKDRKATYSNLPPGKYVFNVASTENDLWSDEPVLAYSFEILPPFWQRWWFISGSVLLFSAIFYWFIQRHDARLQRVNLLEREKAESQLAALKAQINPHFLFNSFNALATVIEENPKTAVEYVEKMADFYRAMLQLRDKEVITLQEEIELVRNYAYLLQKRHGDNFQLNIQLDGKAYYVVPLTLQMLVENAIKHNVIAKDKPLAIDIVTEDGTYITVTNNLQRKANSTDESTGFGLQSLMKRYQLLGNKPLKVYDNGVTFKVSVPLIL